VGYTGTPEDFIDGTAKTLIVYWNGENWSQVTSPKPVHGLFEAVTAVSADDVWAGGGTTDAGGSNTGTLVMHWNGRTWSRQANVPTLPHGYIGDMASSGNSVWAVGGASRSATTPPGILHLPGGSWYVVPSPAPENTFLSCVAAAGGSTVWAAGRYATGVGDYLMRWNGSEWKIASFPLHSAHDILSGMAAGPGGAVWAVGASLNSADTSSTPISMLWNGKAWRKVPVPGPADSFLAGAAFIPGGTAWAVGGTTGATVVMRWTGTAWTRVKSPPDNGALRRVAATSTRNAWAVGESNSGSTLILHWNGTTWS
jgi:hypothetical protein